MDRTGLIDYSRLIAGAKKAISTAATRLRHEHNLALFNRWLQLKDEAGTDEEAFLAEVDKDFSMFCITHVIPDNGLPMFPAPWQIKANKTADEKNECLFIEPRKIGKSAWLSPRILHRACTIPSRQIVIFAPTEDQLVIMNDIYKLVKRSPYLYEAMVRPKDSDFYNKGTFTHTYIEFGWTRAEITAHNLAQNSPGSGDSKRGFKGDEFYVDEIGLVKKATLDEIIDPGMSSAYTDDHKLVKVGTPKLEWNPDLGLEWENVRSDPNQDIGWHHISLWDALDEGAIKRDYIRKRASVSKLNIPCPWLLNEGFCGKVYRPGKTYYDEKHYKAGWDCDECCLMNERWCMENLGIFPESASKFIPNKFVENCGYGWDGEGTINLWPFLMHPQNAHLPHIISGDLGVDMYPTQIKAWEVHPSGVLRLVYWKELPPYEKGELKAGQRSYDHVILAFRQIYWAFYQTKNRPRIYVDATHRESTVNNMTRGMEGIDAKPIPKSAFYFNETAEKKGAIGMCMTGPTKHDMMINYKANMLGGKIMVPQNEPFWSQFRNEHNWMQVNPTGGGYLKFDPPRGKRMDLVDAAAHAAWHLNAGNAVDPAFMGASVKHMGGKPYASMSDGEQRLAKLGIDVTLPPQPDSEESMYGEGAAYFGASFSGG